MQQPLVNKLKGIINLDTKGLKLNFDENKLMNWHIRILTFCFVFVMSLIIYRTIKINRFDNSPSYGFVFGDEFCEKVSLSAAHYFKDSGFTKTAFLPVYEYNPNRQPNEENFENVYTHYPPLGELVASFSAIVLNTFNIKWLSIVPVFFSSILFFLIYFSIKKFTGIKTAALYGTVFLTISPYFIGFGNHIHMHVYMEFFKWLYVFGLWQYWKSGTKNFKYTIALFICSFLCSGFSFEYYIYFAIITIGFHRILKQKWYSSEMLILLAAPPLCFALHLLQNFFYFGSVKEVIEDFKQVFLKRTIGKGDWPNELGGSLTIKHFLMSLPKIWGHRLGMMFGLPFLLLVYSIYLTRKYFKKFNLKNEYAAIFVLFIASLHWALIMPQHAMIHVFTVRHWSILLGLSVGIGFHFFLSLLRKWFTSKKIAKIIFGEMVILYGIIFWLFHSVYFQYLKFGFLYPDMGKEGFEWADNIFW